MRTFSAARAVVVLGLFTWGCGGNGDSNNTSGNPVGPPPAGAAVTINIVANNGSRSYSPDPTTVPDGQMVVWHNVDTATHRVVLNDGKLDTGDLRPGAFSSPMPLVAPGPYHCSIHPDMVGTITH
jgi:plastocyanin